MVFVCVYMCGVLASHLAALGAAKCLRDVFERTSPAKGTRVLESRPCEV